MEARQLWALAQKSSYEEFCELLTKMRVEESAEDVLSFLERNGKEYGYRGQIIKGQSTLNNVPNVPNASCSAVVPQNITYVTNNYYINIVVNIHYAPSAMANIRECQEQSELYSYLKKQGKENLTNKVIKDLNLFNGETLKEGAMVFANGSAKTVGVMAKVFYTLVTFGLYVVWHTVKGTANMVAQPIAKQIGYSEAPVNKDELKGLPAPFQQKIENNEIIDAEIV